MRPRMNVHALFHGHCCYSTSAVETYVTTTKTNFLYGTNKETQFSHVACRREL
jgi:hypothetical protein